ncbi:GLPGLI family protein [Petrimonas sulfuriphila]|uniref:GLPGLI family protein n=1 Tax=Petrimonas sulfuriphila TaxID=285070 RepID=UPI00324BFDC6
MKIKTFIILLSIFLFWTIIGSPALESTQKTPNREILDSAFFRVFYKVEQRALKDGNPIIITDTMALDIGQNWSSYFFIGQDKTPANKVSPRKIRYSSDAEALEKRLTAKQEVLEVRNLRNNLGESAKIFKNKEKNEIITIDQGPITSFDKFALFRIIEFIPPQQWLISEDMLTILNYPCHKATTVFRGRQYAAWFTLDLPMNEGPWKFYGLPGLILKIADNEKVFELNAIGMQELTDTEIAIDWDFRFVSGYLNGSIKQWQAFRKDKFSRITIGFSDGDAVIYYRSKNPIMYPEMKIIE